MSELTTAMRMASKKMQEKKREGRPTHLVVADILIEVADTLDDEAVKAIEDSYV